MGSSFQDSYGLTDYQALRYHLYYLIYFSWLPAGFYLCSFHYETCPPSTAPLVLSTQSPSTAADQGTKHYCWTHLLSSMLFPPARFPILLAVYQQQPRVLSGCRPQLQDPMET
ncbi:hypothetical protein AMECASPLE_018640 [Ameca splendens]|uniref:Uncharacterized protein n=1 Tax=Ameca splendens TaxID=208324 RepID=A0ABV0ZN50_9TELE